MRYLTKSSALASIVIFGMASARNLLRPWDLLPPLRDWQTILQSFESKHEIAKYVKVYVEPVRQLQAAERAAHIDPGDIKSGMLAALDLSIDTMTKFNVTRDMFQNRNNSEIIDAFIETSVEPFGTHNKGLVAPVFNITSLADFAKQRLNDMIKGAKDHRDLCSRCKDYKKHLKYLQMQLKKWKPEYFTYIVPRNMDLNLVQGYTITIIRSRWSRKEGLNRKDYQDMNCKIRSLGNDSSSSRPLSMLVLSIGIISSILLLA